MWWKRPQVSFVDKNVTPGTTYSYRVRATDATGNSSALSTAVSATPTAQAASYASTVRADKPALYWNSVLSSTTSAVVPSNWVHDVGASESDGRRLSGLTSQGVAQSTDSPGGR